MLFLRVELRGTENGKMDGSRISCDELCRFHHVTLPVPACFAKLLSPSPDLNVALNLKTFPDTAPAFSMMSSMPGRGLTYGRCNQA